MASSHSLDPMMFPPSSISRICRYLSQLLSQRTTPTAPRSDAAVSLRNTGSSAPWIVIHTYLLSPLPPPTQVSSPSIQRSTRNGLHLSSSSLQDHPRGLADPSSVRLTPLGLQDPDPGGRNQIPGSPRARPIQVERSSPQGPSIPSSSLIHSILATLPPSISRLPIQLTLATPPALPMIHPIPHSDSAIDPQYLELEASSDHHPSSSLTTPSLPSPSLDAPRRGPLTSSTASSSTSSPPFDPSSPTLQSSCNSGKLSGSFTPASSILNSPPQPDPCRLPNPHGVDRNDEPTIEIGDWTLIEPPPPPRSSRHLSKRTWQPLRKNKATLRQSGSDPTTRFKTHPPLSSSSRLSERNDLIWPVELGNGQGERMSVAPPIEPLSPKPRAASYDIPRSIDICCATGPWVTIDRPSQGPRRLLSSKPHTPIDSSGLPIHERHDHPAPYNFEDRLTDRSGRANPASHQPSSSSIKFVHPIRSKKPSISIGRLTLSSDNVSFLQPDDSKKSPPGHHHSHSIPTFPSFKSFVRPRHLSWNSPNSSPHKPKPSSPASSPILAAPVGSTLTHPSSSHLSSPPARSKRGSFGESSTWRWLKGLNIKSSDPLPKTQVPSSVLTGSSLYSDLPPSSQEPTSSVHSSIFSLLHTPKSTHSNCLSKRPPHGLTHSASDSHFPDSYMPVTGSAHSQRRRSKLPPVLPPKDPRMNYRSTQSHPCSPSSPHDRQYRASRIPFPCNTAKGNHATQTKSSQRRSMKCPKDLVGAFVAIAEPETEKGIELCGLLLGIFDPNQDALVINTLLIPKQVSTSDTCNTFNEDEMFTYQDQMGLMTLGWIHTHPTQTCFMSSVDLHTHLSYQLMLPEAIAIVCSPRKDPSIGIYKLIEPDGMQTILNCKQPGMFHPHPNDSAIYHNVGKDQFRLVDDPTELGSMKLEIVDLR